MTIDDLRKRIEAHRTLLHQIRGPDLDALLAALDVVEQARNVSPRICGAAMVLKEKLDAFDEALR